MNQFRASTGPLVIAHRGACAFAPENTLASFNLAAEQGADAVELDAKLSADGQVMVIHDPTVERTTGGTGVVRAMPYDQLRALDAGSFFEARFAGEKIPTLDEVFETTDRRIMVNVELTNYTSSSDDLVDRVVKIVKRHQLEDWVQFSSFNPLNLVRANRLLPEVPGAILAMDGRAGWWARSFLMRGVSPEYVHPYFSDVSAAYVARQHAKQRRVNVWTINDPADMQRMLQYGVDGLITNDPPAALKVLGR